MSHRKTNDDTEGIPVVILEGLYYEKILLFSVTNPYSYNSENGFIFDIDKDNDLLNYLIYISELDKRKSELKNKQKFYLNIVLKVSKLFDFLSYEK